MTTIAFKDGVIAADSYEIDGHRVANSDCIKQKNINGIVMFGCGESALIKTMMQDISLEAKECGIVNCDSNVWALVDGVIHEYYVREGVYMYNVVDYPYSIGSGSAFALAAMDHGKTASEAVEYAKERDIYTGGKVRTYNIETGVHK